MYKCVTNTVTDFLINKIIGFAKCGDVHFMYGIFFCILSKVYQNTEDIVLIFGLINATLDSVELKRRIEVNLFANDMSDMGREMTEIFCFG